MTFAYLSTCYLFYCSNIGSSVRNLWSFYTLFCAKSSISANHEHYFLLEALLYQTLYCTNAKTYSNFCSKICKFWVFFTVWHLSEEVSAKLAPFLMKIKI
jgi:hypothetical protein